MEMLALHRLSFPFSFSVLIMISQVLVFSSTNSELEFFSLIQNYNSHSPVSNCHVHLWRVQLSYPKISLPWCPFFWRSNLLRHWTDMNAPMQVHTLNSSCRGASTCEFLLGLLNSPCDHTKPCLPAPLCFTCPLDKNPVDLPKLCSFGLN